MTASHPMRPIRGLLELRGRLETRLKLSTHIANLKAAIAVQSFVLVVGTMVITQSRNSAELLLAVLFSGYQIFCAFLANDRFKLACVLIAIPNLAMGIGIGFFYAIGAFRSDPIMIMWLVATSLLGLVALFLSMVPIRNALDKHLSKQR